MQVNKPSIRSRVVHFRWRPAGEVTLTIGFAGKFISAVELEELVGLIRMSGYLALLWTRRLMIRCHMDLTIQRLR